MNSRNNKKDRISILDIRLLTDKSSEKGTEMTASCLLKKGNKPLPDFPFQILINGREPDLIDAGELKTDEHGIATVRFVTSSEEIIASFIVKDEEENFELKKDSRKEKLVEKEKTKKVGDSHYFDITPEISAKMVSVLKIANDFTADTDEAWKILKKWLDNKTAHEKKWFIQTISKAKIEDVGEFLEQLIYLDNKNNEGENENKHRDELARNLGFLPIVDVSLAFNQNLDLLLERDPETYETIITLLQGQIGDKVNYFQFNTAHFAPEYFVKLMHNIAVSVSPDKAATIRGLFNKPIQSKK